MSGYLTIDEARTTSDFSSIIVAEIKWKNPEDGQYLIEDETGTINLKNLNESEPLKVGDIVSVNSFQLDLVKDVLHMTSFDVRKSGLPTQDQIKAILLLKIKTEIPKSEAHARKIINEYIHKNLKRFARFFWLEYGGYGKDIEENAWNLRGDEFWDGLLNNPEIVFPFIDDSHNEVCADAHLEYLEKRSRWNEDEKMDNDFTDGQWLSDDVEGQNWSLDRCPDCHGDGCQACEGTGDRDVYNAVDAYDTQAYQNEEDENYS